jgi:Tfp pilus assembly protein PilX
MKGRSLLRSGRESGSVLLVALFVMVILSLLGAALLSLSGVEHSIAYNAVWSEGAFAAAEAGIQAGINQLGPTMTASTPAVAATNLGGTPTSYRSGHKTDSTAQPLTYNGERVVPGYNIAVGLGYNPRGYSFFSYQINSTGTGPRNAQREIEVLAQFGPVPR